MQFVVLCLRTKKVTLYFDFMLLLIKRKIKRNNENSIND